MSVLTSLDRDEFTELPPPRSVSLLWTVYVYPTSLRVRTTGAWTHAELAIQPEAASRRRVRFAWHASRNAAGDTVPATATIEAQPCARRCLDALQQALLPVRR